MKGAGGLALAALIALALLAPPAFALERLSGFGSYGSGAGQLREPLGIAVDAKGLAYVADYDNDRVAVFAPDGTFVLAFGKEVNPSGGDVCTAASGCRAASGNSAAGALRRPEDLALSPAGELFIADRDNNRVDVFSTDGAFLRAFGEGVNPSGGDVCTPASGCRKGDGHDDAGALRSPTGIGIDAAGKVYVVGESNRVDVFSPDGAFVHAFGKDVKPGGGDVCTAASGCKKGDGHDDAGAMNFPYDVAVAADGRIAVSDSNNRRVAILAPDGGFLRALGWAVNPAGSNVCTAASGCRRGAESGAAGGFAFPSGVAVDGAGRLYVADVRNHRIDELTFDGDFVRAFGEGVENGSPLLQSCSLASGCRAGISSANPGSVTYPYGVATDCRGAIYAVELKPPNVARVERFGEPGTAPPPCTPASSEGPGSAGAATAAGSGPADKAGGEGAGSSPPGSHKVPKPLISIELNKAAGTATLIVVVSDQGTLVLKGKGVRKAFQEVKRPGEAELLVAPAGAARRELQAKGKAKVRISLAFRAKGGGAVVQAKAIVLKKVGSF